MGQFFSYVKRNIKFEFLNPEIKRILKTQSTGQGLNDSYGPLDSDEDESNIDIEMIVLDRPYYIRHFPLTEKD